MSCRETSGNSATTSLVKFVTGASEKLVSHEFHRLRREGREARDGIEPEQTAPTTEVASFLERLRVTAENDERIRESRRLSLLTRIDQALHDNESGKGPNRATFYAWQNLQSAVESNTDYRESTDEPSATGITPEGLEISLGDVEAAKRMAAKEQEKFGYKVQFGSRLSAPRYARKGQQIGTMELWARAERLEAAFDATDVGYEMLKKSEAKDPEHVGHTLWKVRVERAETVRAKGSVVTQARSEAARLSFEECRAQRDNAIARVNHYERLVAAGKQDESNSEKLLNARRQAQRGQRIYLYKVAETASVDSVARSKKLTSPSEWADIRIPDSVPRFDIWRSAELIAADMDRARVRVGRISSEEAARRELQRARARQSILDSEGSQLVDPVNRKFAAAEMERRSLQTKREAV